ncbi:FAD-dependent oxidoreductase [Streptomyces noursei]|uniref:FAD-dependent oxidoreductase n=1 Tax=Streptomyces noursei TaxID=1971 RepID=UPI001E452512|nr:NAD(P)/FAD-dependent oxidoreductase [Streptomyces noursei]MCZ1019967.1 NAD(P)/FAD-dependent oxidoreductase [Streptomyces noursei]
MTRVFLSQSRYEEGTVGMPYPHVIIVGAGLGGLCLAQGLRRRGIDFCVYERDSSLMSRGQGYRIHIDTHGDNSLRDALPPELYQLFRATSGVPLSHTPVFDEQLRQLAEVAGDGGTHLAVDRLTLRQILLTGGEDAVAFGKRVTHYRVGTDGGPVACFDDGTEAGGDVLVAADGVNSPVRRQYLPHARVVDTGLRQLYGKVLLTKETRALFPPEMFAVFTPVIGPAKQFIGVAPVEFPEPPRTAARRLAPTAALNDTADYTTVSFGSRRELLPFGDAQLQAMTGTELRSMTLRLIESWHPDVRRIIEHWLPGSVFPLALRTSVPVPAWRPTHITLLGDAVHAMSPAGGIGANTALRDAGILAAALERAADGRPLVETVAAYESAMTGYGFDAVRLSADNGQRLLGQDPLPTS